jgi:adenosylcobinamide kinase/adenosylcobinamide-phosphate guanylyltransferase
MRTLVLGGGASGKSEYAEELFSVFKGKKYYIATMMPYGEDSLARIEKHRQARRDRGFFTIERYYKMDALELPERGAVLLECLGNLTANELFSLQQSEDKAVLSILSGIDSLSDQTEELVVVTNDVFSGGSTYEGDTLRYIRALGRLNAAIAARFDRVVDVSCGIPVVIKE